jgi:hypothetical protein
MPARGLPGGPGWLSAPKAHRYGGRCGRPSHSHRERLRRDTAGGWPLPALCAQHARTELLGRATASDGSAAPALTPGSTPHSAGGGRAMGRGSTKGGSVAASLAHPRLLFRCASDADPPIASDATTANSSRSTRTDAECRRVQLRRARALWNSPGAAWHRGRAWESREPPCSLARFHVGRGKTGASAAKIRDAFRRGWRWCQRMVESRHDR